MYLFWTSAKIQCTYELQKESPKTFHPYESCLPIHPNASSPPSIPPSFPVTSGISAPCASVSTVQECPKKRSSEEFSFNPGLCCIDESDNISPWTRKSDCYTPKSANNLLLFLFNQNDCCHLQHYSIFISSHFHFIFIFLCQWYVSLIDQEWVLPRSPHNNQGNAILFPFCWMLTVNEVMWAGGARIMANASRRHHHQLGGQWSHTDLLESRPASWHKQIMIDKLQSCSHYIHYYV